MQVKVKNVGQSGGWQVFALSDQGKEEKTRWLARTLRLKWELLPSAELGNKKISFWTEVNESKAKTPGKEDEKYLGQGEEAIPSRQN